MSHFLRENEYQRSQPQQQQQHYIYGHGNKTQQQKPRGLQQQQEIDDDFDGTNYPCTTNKTINRKYINKMQLGSTNDSGNTVKTATILVSKTKTKPALPLLPK